MRTTIWMSKSWLHTGNKEKKRVGECPNQDFSEPWKVTFYNNLKNTCFCSKTDFISAGNMSLVTFLTLQFWSACPSSREAWRLPASQRSGRQSGCLGTFHIPPPQLPHPETPETRKHRSAPSSFPLTGFALYKHIP